MAQSLKCRVHHQQALATFTLKQGVHFSQTVQRRKRDLLCTGPSTETTLMSKSCSSKEQTNLPTSDHLLN